MSEDYFGYHPDPDAPGWLLRPKSSHNRFLDVYGAIRARMESPTLTRLQLTPGPEHRNLMESVHGGFTMAIVDHALFAGPAVQGRERTARASTIDVSTQFLAPLYPGKVIDVLIETLRETNRMVFLRGTIEQDGVLAVAFSGTIRKTSAAS